MFRFLLFCATAWILWIAAGLAGMLVGVVLAFWVLYWLSQVWDEEYDDDESSPQADNGSD